MQRRDDGKVADSTSREDECREEFPVRTGEAEAGERMAGRPWQGEGSPFPLRGEEGRVTGQLEHLRMVKFGSEEEQVKETHLFSQVRRRSSVGMDGLMGWGVGKHWDSHIGDCDFVCKRWPMEGLDG